MPVVRDILAVWGAPRRAIRARLAEGPREDRALAVLMGAAGLSFVAQWPGLARAAHLDPSIPLDARLGGALMATLFILPLVAYALAAAAHLAARLFGGRGSHHGARLALFWAMLAASPLTLLAGAVAGLSGPGPAAVAAGGLAAAATVALWLVMLAEAERGAPAARGRAA